MALDVRHVALALASIVVACVPAPPEAFGPAPINYRQVIAERIRADFLDPSSLQDVAISEPIHGPRVPTAYLAAGWIVCLRANGKNSLGAYAGRHQYGYVFHDGIIVQDGVGAMNECDAARYIEWPEMERGASQGR